MLLGFWGLDEVVSEAVAFYADPSEAATRGFSPVAAVHAAAVLLGRSGLAWDYRYLTEAGLTHRIDKWSRLKEVKHLLSAAG